MKKKLVMFCAALIVLALSFISCGAAYATVEIQAGKPGFTVNTTGAATIGFGGKQWVVIGYDGVNVTAESNTLTLLLKNGFNFGDSTFRNGNITQDDPSWTQYPVDDWYYEGNFTTPHDYNDSTLQKAMNKAHGDNLSAKEQGYVVPQGFAGEAVYDDDSDKVAGASVSDAKFWPLSVREAEAVNSSFLEFSNNWWLRSPGDSFNFAAVVLSGGHVDDYGHYVSIQYAVRPAFILDLSRYMPY